MTHDDDHKAYLEGLKLFHDTLKHLTTLSSGSILILATFIEKFFKNPLWHSLISVSLGAFIVSIGASVIAMAMFATSLQKAGKPNEAVRTIGAVGFLVSGLGFFVGIGSLVALTLKNL